MKLQSYLKTSLVKIRAKTGKHCMNHLLNNSLQIMRATKKRTMTSSFLESHRLRKKSNSKTLRQRLSKKLNSKTLKSKS